MEAYAQNLHISDAAFDGMRENTDRVLQSLLKNMVEKGSLEGKVTISIDVSLTQEFIPNRDPSIEGETRRVLTPKLSHKVGSVMQIKNETKGEKNYDGMELVFDEDVKEYVMKPIANTDQMTIFDADFRCVNDPVKESDEQLALEGRRVAALPVLPEPTDAEVEWVGGEPDCEDDNEELSDDADMTFIEPEYEELPDAFDSDYAYEEPED